MSNKMVNTRIQFKHDTEENWNKAENFYPLPGEVIVYDADETHAYPRVKIGDGVTLAKELPFIHDLVEEDIIIQCSFGEEEKKENE
jgi:hypothetical protein